MKLNEHENAHSLCDTEQDMDLLPRGEVSLELSDPSLVDAGTGVRHHGSIRQDQSATASSFIHLTRLRLCSNAAVHASSRHDQFVPLPICRPLPIQGTMVDLLPSLTAGPAPTQPFSSLHSTPTTPSPPLSELREITCDTISTSHPVGAHSLPRKLSKTDRHAALCMHDSIWQRKGPTALGDVASLHPAQAAEEKFTWTTTLAVVPGRLAAGDLVTLGCAVKARVQCS